ncbi:unnamed protein product [Linum tenue]|uniref:Uncharacterized protein n=1 Tax=Linum tenue TaxID=586396 RepID=A0AAV0I3E3_9ROSI|nr:unnamed protein product [Linum tenue]
MRSLALSTNDSLSEHMKLSLEDILEDCRHRDTWRSEGEEKLIEKDVIEGAEASICPHFY